MTSVLGNYLLYGENNYDTEAKFNMFMQSFSRSVVENSAKIIRVDKRSYVRQLNSLKDLFLIVTPMDQRQIQENISDYRNIINDSSLNMNMYFAASSLYRENKAFFPSVQTNMFVWVSIDEQSRMYELFISFRFDTKEGLYLSRSRFRRIDDTRENFYELI